MNGITLIGQRSLLRAGLVSLLGTIGFGSIEEADDITHLGHICAKPSPNKLIICLALGVQEIVSAVTAIRAWEPTARIVFVVPQLDIDVMSGCFAAGACGYLLETISRDALRESLKLVTAGEKVFPSELASLCPMLTAKFGRPGPSSLATPKSDLSRREIEVLKCLSNGQSNKAIGRILEIAEATVKVHVKRILRKAHVMNRTQAALWGVATGITGITSALTSPEVAS
jgi:two-component system nitrate/nitrite response regulator NarL